VALLGTSMTDTDRLLAVVRQFPGMISSAAFRRAGLKLNNNCRASLIFRIRRAGLLVPATPGDKWGRLYPAESVAPDGAVLSPSGPTRAEREQTLISTLMGSILAAIEPLSEDEQIIIRRAVTRLAARRAL
jgi:hypothetical protein